MADEAQKQGVKLTPLAFIMKAVVAALKYHPEFNASLAPAGDALILKRYYHIGVAVDTPGGLVVPVIREVDQKGVLQLAKELADISAKAREGKLGPNDMQGGSVFHLQPRRHRRHAFHADHQRTRSRHSRHIEVFDETGLEGRPVRAAADAAAVAVL